MTTCRNLHEKNDRITRLETELRCKTVAFDSLQIVYQQAQHMLFRLQQQSNYTSIAAAITTTNQPCNICLGLFKDQVASAGDNACKTISFGESNSHLPEISTSAFNLLKEVSYYFTSVRVPKAKQNQCMSPTSSLKI